MSNLPKVPKVKPDADQRTRAAQALELRITGMTYTLPGLHCSDLHTSGRGFDPLRAHQLRRWGEELQRDAVGVAEAQA
jgi:hypothetical protein